jgi:hypothetical protein
MAPSGYETPIAENCSGILPRFTSRSAEQPIKGEKPGDSTAKKETVEKEPKKSHFEWGVRGEYQYDPRHCEEWW